jgi:hypothetical protein
MHEPESLCDTPVGLVTVLFHFGPRCFGSLLVEHGIVCGTLFPACQLAGSLAGFQWDGVNLEKGEIMNTIAENAKTK